MNSRFVIIYNMYRMVYVYKGKIKKQVKVKCQIWQKMMAWFSCSYKDFKYLITYSPYEIKYKSVALRNQFWNIFLKYCWVPFAMLLSTSTCFQRSVWQTAQSWSVLFPGKQIFLCFLTIVLSFQILGKNSSPA